MVGLELRALASFLEGQGDLVSLLSNGHNQGYYMGSRGCYLEVHCTYNLLSNCSYNLIISRVTVDMGLIIRL